MDSLINFVPYFKALHIIGFVSWFAGMFYLGRMFVYHTEAMDKPQPERDILTKQFNIMQWRAYKIICTPAMNITWTFGILMIVAYGMDWFKLQPWLHIKLLLVIILSGFHGYIKTIIKKMEAGKKTFTSFQFRLMNEVPTLFLVSIVLFAVLKNNLNVLYTFIGVFVFGLILYIATKLYKRARERTG